MSKNLSRALKYTPYNILRTHPVQPPDSKGSLPIEADIGTPLFRYLLSRIAVENRTILHRGAMRDITLEILSSELRKHEQKPIEKI